MRIVGGKYKGRRLHIPKGLPVRPTTDRTREALFNILPHHINLEGKKVLDLFCGTGIISAEFLSRGLEFATGVDRHWACVKSFQQLMEQLDLSDQAKGVKSSSEKYCARIDQAWDIIFMDPPYAFHGIPSLLESIFNRTLLKKGGICIVEHDPRKELDKEKHFLFSRKYGSSGLSFFGGE